MTITTGTGAPLTPVPGTSSVGPVSLGQLNAPGLVARLAPISGITPRRVLSHKIYLPALLNTVTASEQATHNEYETLSAGTFSQPAMGPPSVGQLRTLPLDSLIMAWDPEWIVVSGQNPVRLRNSLFGVLRARSPVHLLLTWNPHPGGWPEWDMDVTLRSATREIRPQELDTHYISVQVSEWRDPRVGVDSSRPEHRGKHLDGPVTYKLGAGDSLLSLSLKFYGTYAHWREIRAANGITVRFGQSTPLTKLGGKFKVGAKIKIPAKVGG